MAFDCICIDFKNPNSKKHIETIKQIFPYVEITPFVKSYNQMVKHFVGASKTEYTWILSSLIDYSNFDFDYIFNISEDGWFGKSVGPKQHLVHSVYRAIESGKYVIRSSNNGVGVIINPLGEIENKIDYGKDGFIDFNKRRDIEQTVFSKYGNKIFFILILLYIFLIFSFNRIKNE